MNILGYEYDVEYSTVSGLNGNAGECDLSNQTLRLATDIKMDAISSTLIHEILEALNYHLELDLKHNQISSLETGLFQVLSSNGVDLSLLTKEKS